MGLLDEAIKQHLDLKRRRGADPGEIERLEREALGPVRPLPQEPPAEGTAPAGEGDIAYEEHEYAEEPYGEHDLGPEDDYEPEEEEDLEFPSPRTASAPEAPIRSEAVPDQLGARGVEPPEEDVLANDLTEPEEKQSLIPEDGVETMEYDVEAEHAREEGEPGSEEADMLEETPEFFQDAPDHDRLWFEQRPPRDFDFEG